MGRFKEIDMLKGLGIIFMVMGHQYYGEMFDKWIHAFHMPMFFIISGFLYSSPKSFGEKIYKKMKTLLIPYAFFASFHFLIASTKVFILDEPINKISSYLYHICVINTEGVPICGAIWFLTALFFVTIIYMLIDKFSKSKVSKIIWIFCLVIIGIFCPLLGYRLPWALDVAFVGVGLFFVGEVLRTFYDNKDIKRKGLWVILGIFLSSGTIFMNYSVNLRLGCYGNVILFFVNVVLMTSSLFYLCNILGGYDYWILREVQYIGENSIVYLGFNQFILLFLKKISVNNIYFAMLVKIILLIICFLILHIIAKILSNSRIKCLIGK
ncbi:MAG: acyltransferase family protein [Clostridium sp.]|uniref:acyltransferase family protein n=1 Tax=Clostridium sp. TaxID=1506 RepID=UPI00290EF166|nr:acyltransferase family protein [Clostridium sp.]MDU5741517.1 acyltransferase family protein [Clostridium sp.]MDU5785971.1 acyltransferase family protein [Clostridium sp.]